MNHINTVLTHLRNLRPVEGLVPSLEQVRLAVDDIRAGAPLESTVERPIFDGWTASDVVSMVEALGRYLAQSRKDAVKGIFVDWEDSGLLFPLGQQDIANLQAAMKGRGGRAARAAAMLPPGSTADSNIVHLPPGWTASDRGRDIRKSVSTTVVGEIEQTEILRFIERHYRRVPVTMTADHVYLLVWLVEQQLLERLTELTAQEAELAAALVQAWDLLEVSAQDANRSIKALISASESEHLDAQALLHDCLRASWIAPGEIARVSGTLEQLCAMPDNEDLRVVARRRLATFTQVVARSSLTREVRVPEDITEGRAQLICEQAGLLSDEAQERAVRDDIREQLNAMGLGNDLDREMGEGVRAWKLGLLEEFYASRRARAQGDLHWSAAWEETLAEVSATV